MRVESKGQSFIEIVAESPQREGEYDDVEKLMNYSTDMVDFTGLLVRVYSYFDIRGRKNLIPHAMALLCDHPFVS